jgi:hypothetical protein
MSLIDSAKNFSDGVKTLKEWLGDGGKVVPQEKADSRALACTRGNGGNPCPRNIAPRWWNVVKHESADAIKRHLALKHSLKIYTPSDDSLHMCGDCGCCLSLKVHVPIEYIKSHTTPEQLAKYKEKPWCWQGKELSV